MDQGKDEEEQIAVANEDSALLKSRNKVVTVEVGLCRGIEEVDALTKAVKA